MATYKGTVQIDATSLGCGLTVKGSGGKRVGDPADKSWADVPDWVCGVLKGNAGCAVEVTTADGPPETISSVKVG